MTWIAAASAPSCATALDLQLLCARNMAADKAPKPEQLFDRAHGADTLQDNTMTQHVARKRFDSIAG